jgi:folate-binding protein YgfZ
VNEAWKKLMVSDGASLLPDASVTFRGVREDVRAAANLDVVADMSHRALIRVSGPDAATFLQGQLSNDIRLVDAERSQISSYNSPKGRMLAVVRILRRGDDYLLQLPAALVDDLVRRLRMYVLRARVTLENAQARWLQVGVSGAGCAPKLEAVTALRPPDAGNCATDDGLMVARVPGSTPRFELIVAADAASGTWRRLRAAGLAAVGPAAWSWLDILAGLPVVLPATADAFVPQMANLDVLDGINFAKGCYTGQEIVARMQYLGRLKQRMYLAHVDGDAVPLPGDPLYASDFGEQAAGTVVDAQPAPGEGCDLLAVAQTASADRGELHLGRADGPRLTLRSLPYRVPASDGAAVS